MKIKNDKIAEVKDDMLNRNAVAENIAKGLRGYLSKNKEGMTLSVTGGWGAYTCVKYSRTACLLMSISLLFCVNLFHDETNKKLRTYSSHGHIDKPPPML